MSINDFVREREHNWQRLEALIAAQRKRRLKAAEVYELGTLYRAVASDLALARRDFPQQRAAPFLNQLLTRAHNAIYSQDRSDLGRLLHYCTHSIPQVFRETGLFTLAAFLLFMIPAVIGYRQAQADDGFVEMLGLAEQRAVLEARETWTGIPPEQRPFASTFIMANNIRVALLAFGGGVAFGVFTVWILATNGVYIGAVLGLAARYGMDGTLWGFIVGHGVIELSIIFIAGGAGLQLGWALLNPGPYTRRDALALAGRRAVSLAVLAIPMLIIAGLIEGFISPSALPVGVRAAVGLGSGLLMMAYLLLAGRSKTT
jgi:uncharacterized membrane protein SpoIIM required for sporulation